jgi:putative transposase
MSRTISSVSGKSYGLALVCRTWRVPRATVYRHRAPPLAAAPQRPGPVGPMVDAALLERIRAVLAASPFHGEGHRKVWARLRIAGIRTSRPAHSCPCHSAKNDGLVSVEEDTSFNVELYRPR